MTEIKKANELYFTFHNGNKVPALGLGTANHGDKIPQTKEAVKTAIRAGYRHIDTAWVYETEHIIGEALKELFEDGEIKREDLFITTKIGTPLAETPEISLNQSLKELGIDYVDLLLQHWPTSRKPIWKVEGVEIDRKHNKANNKNPVEYDFVKYYKAIEDLYEKYPEKVKNIGVSNYSTEFLEKLLKEAKHKPVINQIELHPNLSQRDLVKFNTDNGILVTAYSPLGSSGAPNAKIPLVLELAEKYKTSPNAILSSYHINQGVIVIPKSVNEERIKQVTELIPLTEEELEALNKIGEENPQRFIAPEFGRKLGFKHWP
ncbi:hypothetical protein WICMUC_005158 [Wickerhamomyces mucosus]|uniref:NADP-dependent oxidoreductase domain-containing protein n=1 Tax=Wickerhamomyces mucosus TaxID=1378264 RepID=A0A9P8T778_9ASCO|nr:hypothetical protein WICMUC_005158 [Wickerhamomyces mucosus]